MATKRCGGGGGDALEAAKALRVLARFIRGHGVPCGIHLSLHGPVGNRTAKVVHTHLRPKPPHVWREAMADATGKLTALLHGHGQLVNDAAKASIAYVEELRVGRSNGKESERADAPPPGHRAVPKNAPESLDHQAETLEAMAEVPKERTRNPMLGVESAIKVKGRDYTRRREGALLGEAVGPREAARQMGVSPSTIWRWMEAENLTGKRDRPAHADDERFDAGLTPKRKRRSV